MKHLRTGRKSASVSRSFYYIVFGVLATHIKKTIVTGKFDRLLTFFRCLTSCCRPFVTDEPSAMSSPSEKKDEGWWTGTSC